MSRIFNVEEYRVLQNFFYDFEPKQKQISIIHHTKKKYSQNQTHQIEERYEILSQEGYFKAKHPNGLQESIRTLDFKNILQECDVAVKESISWAYIRSKRGSDKEIEFYCEIKVHNPYIWSDSKDPIMQNISSGYQLLIQKYLNQKYAENKLKDEYQTTHYRSFKTEVKKSLFKPHNHQGLTPFHKIYKNRRDTMNFEEYRKTKINEIPLLEESIVHRTSSMKIKKQFQILLDDEKSGPLYFGFLSGQSLRNLFDQKMPRYDQYLKHSSKSVMELNFISFQKEEDIKEPQYQSFQMSQLEINDNKDRCLSDRFLLSMELAYKPKGVRFSWQVLGYQTDKKLYPNILLEGLSFVDFQVASDQQLYIPFIAPKMRNDLTIRFGEEM